MTKFLWYCEDDVKVIDREEFLMSFLDPLSGFFVMTGRAATIAAGVVMIMHRITRVTLHDVTSQHLSATLDDISYGTSMTGKNTVTEPF
jgi:hypothetical protein